MAADNHSADLLDSAVRRAAPLLIVLLVFARLVTLLALPLDGLHGFGDLPWFYAVAALDGWPYLQSWSEFPPLFPFLSEIIYRMVGGGETAYTYAMVLLLTLADCANLFLFARLARRLHNPLSALLRTAGYFLVLAILPYCWWYLDPFAVLTVLLALSLFFEDRPLRAGVALGVGVLVKFFPAIALVWVWRQLPVRKALAVTGVTLAIAALGYGSLYALSPEYTRASLASQGSKGSWETVWALLDGNYNTGLFGPLQERFDPAAAYQSPYNPAVIAPLASLAVFGLLGLAGFYRAKRGGELAGISLVGLAWCVFLLWSPGWSPQWVLYLLPLIALAFAGRLATLLAALMILVNLAEWPVALTHGRPDVLTMTILLRTFLLILMAWLFYRQARSGEAVQ